MWQSSSLERSPKSLKALLMSSSTQTEHQKTEQKLVHVSLSRLSSFHHTLCVEKRQTWVP